MPSPNTTLLFRSVSGSRTDHFYTSNFLDLIVMKSDGYLTSPESPLEPPVGYIFKDQEKNTVPLYMLYSQADHDHFYTISEQERERFSKNGFMEKGIVGYVYNEVELGSRPVYRAYNPTWLDHFYTQDLAEVDRAVAMLGFQDKQVAFHVLPI